MLPYPLNYYYYPVLLLVLLHPPYRFYFYQQSIGTPLGSYGVTYSTPLFSTKQTFGPASN